MTRPAVTHPARASAVALLAMIACVLGDVVAQAEPLRLAARLLLLAYLALEWPRMAANARTMVGLAAVMTAAFAVTRGSPGPVVAAALDNGTFFATFFANQFFLREAARTSPLVHRCSSFFIDQPPRRRYALLTLGGYLFGMILNLGVLSLLGLMIKRRNTLAAADGNPKVHAVRQRRMVTALLRGFSVAPVASPLSLSLAIMLTALPDLRWGTMAPLGLVSGALILSLGWLEDWLAARHLTPPPGQSVASDYPAVLGIAAIVLAVLGCAKALEAVAHVPLGRAIVVSLPLVGLAWLAFQHRRHRPVKGAALYRRRIVKRAAKTFPAYRSEIAILSSAGFIGSLFAAFIPPEAMGSLMNAPWLPPLALAPALLVVVVLAGLLGINPIVSVTILASALQAAPPAAVPLEPLALALMMGWTLTINSSALTASAMLLAEMVGTSARTIVFAWNGAFSLAAVAAASLWLATLAVLLR